jgi:hypothetical protein
MNSTSIRNKLYDYIRFASDKKLHAMYQLLEDEVVEMNEWWKDKQFVEELDSRYNALESGEDKGITLQQMETTIEKMRLNKYGK